MERINAIMMKTIAMITKALTNCSKRDGRHFSSVTNVFSNGVICFESNDSAVSINIVFSLYRQIRKGIPQKNTSGAITMATAIRPTTSGTSDESGDSPELIGPYMVKDIKPRKNPNPNKNAKIATE